MILLILAVAAVQQMAISSPPPAREQAGTLAPPDTQFETTCRIAVMLHQLGREDESLRPLVDAGGGGLTPKEIRSQAETPEDRFRAAVVIAELNGADAGLRELETLAEVPDKPPALEADAAALQRILRGGEATTEEAAHLREDHGWFGRLALVIGKPDTDPERQAVVGRGMDLITLFAGAFLLGGAAMLAGFVLFIVGLVKWQSGSLRPRFTPMPRGGSALIEMVAVFIVSFLVLKEVAGLVGSVWPGFETGFALTVQWLLLLVALWPIVRGMPRPAAMHALGLYRGRGFFREVGAGIVGYLACLPLLLLGMISMIVLMFVEQQVRKHLGKGEPGPVHNPVYDLVAGDKSSPWMVVVVFLLATVWAPVMEEIVFRGALFGHLRKRWGVLASALVVAPAFGLMHGYPLILLGGVMSLGFGFSLLREWRGSLIAPMVAHCINNFAVLTLVITMMRVLK